MSEPRSEKERQRRRGGERTDRVVGEGEVEYRCHLQRAVEG